MTRLFLRLSLGILMIFVVSLLLIPLVGRHRLAGRVDRMVHRPHRTMGLLIRQGYADQAPADRPAYLDSLRRALKTEVRLLPFERARIHGPARRDLAEGRPAVAGPRGRHRLFVPVEGGRRVVVVDLARISQGKGPKPPFPRGRIPLTPPLHFILIFLVTIAVGGFLIAWPLARQLKQLERAVDQVGAGDLHARTGLEPKGAIGTLAGQFDRMAERIQSLVENQRNLLQAVSHELRTPIARVGFSLEMLSTEKDENVRRRRVEAIEEELVELNALVDELLLFVRFDKELTDGEKEACPIRPILEEWAGRDYAGGESVEVHLGPEIGPDRVVRAIPAHLKRALHNLLANACLHARERVEVHLEAEAGWVRIRVEDDGPGIPPAERDNVLEPFHRLDRSRSRESGGAGLGLAIVKRIMDAHGGRVAVDESALGGAALTLAFPDPPT